MALNQPHHSSTALGHTHFQTMLFLPRFSMRPTPSRTFVMS